MIYQNARFDTGHVKVVTRAYNELISQKPFDLGLLGIEDLMKTLAKENPEIIWTPRIHFGGLIDVPDENGETVAQGQVAGFAVDLQSDLEIKLLKLEEALKSGRLPAKPGEILISDALMNKLNLTVGDRVTMISSTMYGSMAIGDFNIAGSVKFGMQALDRGGIVASINDIRNFLDMDDGASEILGFFPDFEFHQPESEGIARSFNEKYTDEADEFSPQMITILDQNGLRRMLETFSSMVGVFLFTFVLVMAIVLWNSGLMNGLRRYGEIGVRLAIGESKGHVYKTLIYEGLVIGFIGSIVGTIFGLLFSLYLQEHGIDTTSYYKDSTMIMDSVMRAKISATSYYYGFIPGITASLLGVLMAGIGIFKRQTSQLFKELEQ